jgi:hypothetical protein
MKSITEQTETAPSAATNETKATKKVTVGARLANVAPAKPKAGKKAIPAKKAPKSAKKAAGARDGSKTATILETLKRPGGATPKELLKATNFPARVPLGHRREEDGLGRHFHEGRRRRAQLLRQSLIHTTVHHAPSGSSPAAFLVVRSLLLRRRRVSARSSFLQIAAQFPDTHGARTSCCFRQTFVASLLEAMCPDPW